MRKVWFIIVIIAAAAMLAACGQATAPVASTATAVPTAEPQAPAMSCQVVSMSPTPGATEVSMFPQPQEDDWIKGSNDAAPLVITEYSDFQCPYCADLALVLDELHEKHPAEVRVIFRHFPLPSHELALPGAHAAEAAGLQGKFWDMHDKIFGNQQIWAGMTVEQFEQWLSVQAGEIGLDVEKFNQDVQSEAIVNKVLEAQQHGLEIGIPGTPLLLLNGQYYQGPRDVASLEAVLRLFQLKDRQFTDCPPMLVDPAKQYSATLKTEKGDIVVQLFPDKAPMAVNSFVFLAREGWFNDVTFHRVLEGFVAQTGDPSASGFGGPGYYFENEISDLKFDQEGLLGMANSGPSSNGSQFFITFAPAPQLDGQYTIFGQVIEGLDVAKTLTARDPSQGGDLPPGDKILSVEIEEN